MSPDLQESPSVHAAPPGSKQTTRPWGLALLALVIGVGLVALLAIGLSALTQSSKTIPPAQPLVQPAASPTTFRPSVPAATERAPQPVVPQPTALPAPARDAVATVNGQVITAGTARTVQAADRAVGRLLGQAMAGESDLLDRLVNTELVRQAADAAGFTLSEAEVTQALTDFLTGLGKSHADLVVVLAAEGLSVADFQVYFGQLILVDQFTQAQAQAQGITVAAYLGRLQQAARISFGPAAQALLRGQATAAPAAPSPTTAPPTPSPAPPAPSSYGLDAGQLAPEFVLPALAGTENPAVQLAGFRGRPVVLSFWTTWCPHCQQQTPVMVDAAARYAAHGIHFIGINVREDRPIVQNYVRANKILYPIALDTRGEIADLYRVTGYPTTYFLDATGRIAAQHVGQLSTEQIDDYLTRLVTSDN